MRCLFLSSRKEMFYPTLVKAFTLQGLTLSKNVVHRSSFVWPQTICFPAASLQAEVMTDSKRLSVVVLDCDKGENLDVGVQVWRGDSRGWHTVIFFLFLVSEEAARWGEVLQICYNRISSLGISKVTMDSMSCHGSQIKEALSWHFWACSLKFCSRYTAGSQQQTQCGV